MDIVARFIDDTSIHGQLAGTGTINAVISGEAESIHGIVEDYAYIPEKDKYKGEYVVTPKKDSTILDTDHKYMLDDLTVNAIPYYETQNDSGITA